LPIHVKYEGKFSRQKDKAQIKGQKENAPLIYIVVGFSWEPLHET
jgi:hypothetical protein